MPKARATLKCLSTLAVLALIWAGSGMAAPPAQFKPRAEKTFAQAEMAYKAATDNPTNAWKFAQACFDLAEFSATAAERANLAHKGMAAAEAAISSAPELAAGHYFLALNKGQLARTKSLGALPLVDQMEKHLQRAAELDKLFEYGGPNRTLGLLYLDAPGWPTSIGNKRKARQRLESALALHPEFPENHLCLLEALLKSKESARALELLPAASQAMKEGKARFTGESWAQNWADWTERWRVIQADLR